MHKRKGFAWETSYLLKDKAKEKLALVKDVQWLALIIMEIFLTLILVGSIVIYLDGRFNTIEFPFNLIIFAAIAYAVMRVYAYTENFRELRGMKRESSFRAFVLEFIIFLVIVFSTFLYQDPTINIFPFPYNFLIFLILLVIPLYFYMKEQYFK